MEDVHVTTILFLIVAGFVAAFVDSVVGGGGLISIPVLMFAGLPLPATVGTNKIAAGLSLITSSFSFLRSSKVEKKVAFSLFPLSLGGAVLGALTVNLIPGDVLKPIVVSLLVGVVVLTLMKKKWGFVSTFRGFTPKTALLIGLATFGIGFYDGFLGAGTGIFLLFAFVLLGFDFLTAAGNAKVLNLASNIGALLAFFHLGVIHYSYGIPMGLAMVAGAYVGSKVAIAKGASYVKALFVSVALVLIGKQLWDMLLF
jgi:uncharacterized membrane protein YfcA